MVSPCLILINLSQFKNEIKGRVDGNHVSLVVRDP